MSQNVRAQGYTARDTDNRELENALDFERKNDLSHRNITIYLESTFHQCVFNYFTSCHVHPLHDLFINFILDLSF